MPTIGQQLKQARESRGLSMKQVVQATRIRVHYLEAMETDDFSTLPSAAQARGFLRSYADFLGLNADDLISRQRNETGAIAEFTTPNQVEPAAAPQPLSAAEPSEPQPETEDRQPQPEPEPAPREPEPEPAGGEEPQQPGPPSASQLIFVEIGGKLRQRRELLSLTLDEIERHTHVRKYYLEIIEAGNFDQLPSPVQARGMLSNYSTFLDMDTEATLLRFADALQAKRLERQASLPPTAASSRRRIALPLWVRRFVSPDLLFGGGMILLLFILTVWGAARIFSRESTSGAQAPSISDVLLASPSAATQSMTEALPTDVQVNSIVENVDTLTPTETLSSDAANADLQVTISVLERTFVRVTVDGVVKQEGRVVPGFAQTFDGVKSIEVLTGSGSGIQIRFNQRDLGLMGNFGQVVDLVYTVNGAQTPTMIPTPTSTVTPRFQKTPTLTPTETLTRTPTITPTVKQ
ncbi:MAG: RodZ domain-containing protein [Anaerolineales bacterium]